MWDSEVSSVDTAILLCGILTCRQYFHHPEINLLARNIFNRVDWTWLSEDTTLLPQGWTPEVGFLPSRGVAYGSAPAEAFEVSAPCFAPPSVPT